MNQFDCYSIIHDCYVTVVTPNGCVACIDCYKDLTERHIYVHTLDYSANFKIYCEECGIANEVALELEKS